MLVITWRSSDKRKSNPTLWGLLPGKIPVWRQDVTRTVTVNKGAEDPGAEKEEGRDDHCGVQVPDHLSSRQSDLNLHG